MANIYHECFLCFESIVKTWEDDFVNNLLQKMDKETKSLKDTLFSIKLTEDEKTLSEDTVCQKQLMKTTTYKFFKKFTNQKLEIADMWEFFYFVKKRTKLYSTSQKIAHAFWIQALCINGLLIVNQNSQSQAVKIPPSKQPYLHDYYRS